MSIQTAADKTSLYCVLVLHQSSALDLLLTMTMMLPLPLLCLVTMAWTHRSNVSGSEGKPGQRKGRVGSPAGDGVYEYIICFLSSCHVMLCHVM